MSKTVGLILGALGVLGGFSLSHGQNYKCDWSVVGIGGGEMTGTAHKCGATVGQTAAGQLTGTSYWALIGYWQPEGQTGVREAAQWSSGQVVETRLYTPQPNPARTHVAIRYSLSADARVCLRVHDLTGRVVRTLCASSMKRGTYSITWNGTDDRGRELVRGVYFCRLTAGDYRATEKLVLQR
jgi:hypothetical protein